jgi:hypothetical protein
MDLLEIHRRVRLALNKDITGYLSPEEIDRALDRAQLMEMRHLYGDDRKLPNSPLAYGMTLKIHADLTPFKRSVNFTTGTYNESSNTLGTGPAGVMVFPQDYLYPIAITVKDSGVERTVKIVSEDEIGIRMASALRPPTASRPIAVLGGTDVSGISFVAGKNRAQLFPERAYTATLYYLSRPAIPELKGTTSGRVFTYDRVSTVQLQWPDTAIDRVIERAIAILAENLQEGEIGNNNYNKALQ